MDLLISLIMIIGIAILIVIVVDLITDKFNRAKEKAERKQKINLTLLSAVTTGICSNANYTNYNYGEVSSMILSQYTNLVRKVDDGTI